MLVWLCLSGGTSAGSLADELGRSESRVQGSAYPLTTGRTVWQIRLAERLDRLGYERVRSRPGRAGEYFWGNERFWIFRRAHRVDGRSHPARLFSLDLRASDGMIVGARDANDRPLPITGPGGLRLEPELISESLDGERAVRRRLALDDLPERVWRPVLAAEDARFFDHVGIDGRSIARALLANVRSGSVEQGGSTITQQLIKNRDLTPRRTLGRKASEALRALALEAEYDKREILEAYLDNVYLGHVDGLAVHGFGTAARAYFSKPAAELSLAESATLAAMIQGPNRLSPLRHAERLLERRNWVLDRMAELGWGDPESLAAARAADLRVRTERPRRPPAAAFLSWIAAAVEERHPKRLENGRGVVVETSLDPLLQQVAEEAVKRHLSSLRRDYRRLRSSDLSAALVALDARSGAVLAWVGGDPSATADRFDRVSRARRQPGSAVKPLVLLEPFQSCGDRDPLHAATRVADEPLEVELSPGRWIPENFDQRFHGVVDIRAATRASYNVPFVRLARWCGERPVVERIRRAGLPVPADPPPSFVLGALEVTPLELAAAFTVWATPGRVWKPYGIERIERPGGSRLSSADRNSRRVVDPGTAYLIRDLLRDAVRSGTGQQAAVDGIEIAGKTGTSSDLRDAWFVGDGGSLVTAVWVGLDRDGALGLTGGVGAAPLWREFIRQAVPARPGRTVPRPRSIVERRVDPESGLVYPPRSDRGRAELFRRDALPRTRRIWKPNRPEPVVR